MPSQLSFFLNLSTSLLGLPRAGKGFPKLLLLFPRGLASKILLGTACICFSIQIFTKVYIELYSLWIHRQIDLLNDLLDHRELMCTKLERKVEKLLAVIKEVDRDAEQWQKSREDLVNFESFARFDRELPYFLDEKDVDFDPSLIWNQQDEEIARRHSALVRSWEEMEIKHDWTRNASKEVNRAYDVEKEERKRILEKVSYLRSTRFLVGFSCFPPFPTCFAFLNILFTLTFLIFLDIQVTVAYQLRFFINY